MKNRLKELLLKLTNLNIKLGFILLFLGIIVIFIPSIPQLWYRAFPNSTVQEIEKIATVEKNITAVNTSTKIDTLPKKDTLLPKTNYIYIDKIGVKSPISNGKNYESILKKGSWMVNDFPTPDENSSPVIVAAHRFGYIYWNSKERKELSFYNLPKLKNGDIVEIIWEQRLYKYKIVASSEGTEIKSYNYDLILYTCKLYSSPLRIFKYAQRTN